MPRASIRAWLAAAAAYVVVTAAAVEPLVDYVRLADASYEGDSRLIIWTLAWDAHAALTGTPLFSANIFFPTARALSWAEHHAGIAFFALPVYAASHNAVLAYWIVWLAAFPLNALAMHALAWRITRSHPAAFIAGVVYAFCFFRMHHAHGHLQLLWTWPLPLVPLLLEAWLDRPAPRRAAALTAVVLIQALSSWYLAVFAGLLGAISLAVLAPATRWSRAHLIQAIACVLPSAAALAWFAAPYLGLQSGPPAEAAANAADLAAYLMPPENTIIGQWLLRNGAWTPTWIWGEQTLYVGATTAALAIAGVVGLRRRPLDRILAAVVLSGLLALALSFGPSATGAAPFDLLAHLPAMGLLRAPARFALLVMMAVALLAAMGVATLAPRRAAAAVLAAAILLEAYVVAFPGGKPRPLPVPRVYRELAGLPRGAVLSLPTYRATPEAFREADYLLFSTMHWQPIVNGFGRQEPPDHAARMNTFTRFPAEDAVALMRRLGVRYVVVHTRRASELSDRVEMARQTAGIRLVSEGDGDFLFEVQP